MFFFFYFEQTQLIIKSERLGDVEEITSFLTDLNLVYQQLSIFFIITSDEEQIKSNDTIKKYLRTALLGKKKLKKNKIRVSFKMIKKSLVSYQIPNLRLERINIQSPGFWEIVGSMNPLQQIREYIKEKHEREKDKEYRNDLEKAKGILDLEKQRNEIVEHRIKNLKLAGYNDDQIQRLVLKLYANPLILLDKHLDSGLITGVE